MTEKHSPGLLGSSSAWVNYAIAVAACALVIPAQFAFTHILTISPTPFLLALAAVIFTAAWAGPGPGWTATVILTAWCGWYTYEKWPQAPMEAAVRCVIFAAEGALVIIGSGRLRRASRELTRSNLRLRQLVDTAGEGILIQGVNGVVTYANTRMKQMLAMGRVELEGRRFDDFVFAEDLPAERMRLQRRRVAAGEHFDRRLRRADGAELWVLSSSNPLFDDRHEFAGMLSMMTDITERKAAEIALRRSEEKFRGLFENVLEGVYQSTPDGRILAANPMLLKMLGLASESEMNDVNISKDLYVDPNVRSRLLVRLEREGSFRNVEYELRRRDGEIITVLENARVVRDSAGEVLYYEGTLTDITEKNRVEERLRQAQKTEALRRLAAGVAQDFNSIMTVITGYCELLATNPDSSLTSREHAQQALKAAETAGMLTKQLLALNTDAEAEEVSLDVNRVLQEIESGLRASLGEAVELRLSLCEAASVCLSQRDFEQIVINLATNAREAMPNGGEVEISTETTQVSAELTGRIPGAQPGAYVRLAVRDTGFGIPPGLIEKVTDPLFTMGKSRVTGLGLSLVDVIAGRHGGFMRADSTPGLGATFYVYLPSAPPARSKREALRGARPGETILLVEDELLMRELSRDMLERLGYRVVVAAGPEEAESIAESARRLDLVVASIAPGQASGAGLARRLASLRPALKVLVLSGRAGWERDEISARGDRAEYLKKPFSHDALGRKVREILDRR